eukprot:CAMPEP_0182513054 /NCGR_PEP_ID=MMETSP1321-20130603/33304_1 /TAXON_ID=91990 /ORGANISM="Bolidomonas sp., Strain RCC1657" /LENGTH=109 /DNA_ID=CAMNT_0024719999 /DNA_START=512 /DNA_END=838 /DNA_ORIENTATION=+
MGTVIVGNQEEAKQLHGPMQTTTPSHSIDSPEVNSTDVTSSPLEEVEIEETVEEVKTAAFERKRASDVNSKGDTWAVSLPSPIRDVPPPKPSSQFGVDLFFLNSLEPGW